MIVPYSRTSPVRLLPTEEGFAFPRLMCTRMCTCLGKPWEKRRQEDDRQCGIHV